MRPLTLRPVRAVDRALDILVTLGGGDFRLVELSERLRLHKATVSRLLETMGRTGIVVRTEAGGYSLGSRMVVLAGQILNRRRRIADVLRDPLHRIWRETGETVAVHVRVGLERLCVAEIETLQPIGYRAGIGTRAPLHAGAPGKVLLAWLPEPEQTRVLRDLRRLPASDGVEFSLDGLRDELERIRGNGYAMSVGEHIPRAFAVSVPVSGVDGAVVAAVSVHGPESRFSPDARTRHALFIVREIRSLIVPMLVSADDGGSKRPPARPRRSPRT